MLGFGLSQVVSEPTQISCQGRSLIDHAYVSDATLLSNKVCQVLPPLGTSDHSGILLTLSLRLHRIQSISPRRVWQYSRADFDYINAYLEDHLPSSHSPDMNCVNLAWESFHNIYLSVMKKFIPSKIVSGKSSLPWLIPPVRRAIERRNRTHREAKRHDSPDVWCKFRLLRNRAVAILRQAKKLFFDKFTIHKGDQKSFWKVYHSVTAVKSRVPAVLYLGNSSSNDAVGKAELLNQHFVSVFNQKTSSSLDLPEPPIGVPRLSNITCSPEEVHYSLATLRHNVATGPDEISSVMLRQTASVISPFLAGTFNQSLSQGKFPVGWKAGNVTPVFKSGDPSNAANYRPITLLSLISKSLERLVHNAIMDHLLKNNLLSDKQFGFRPGASTQEAVLQVTRACHLAMELGNSTGCVFFDISKAFDTLPHHLVLLSLVKVGISGSLLLWLQDYLTDRSQRVVLYGAASQPANVTSGVPQGSILGPLLFIIFMDSLCTMTLSPRSGLTMYADDICYHKEVASAADCDTIQEDVNLIFKWASNHDLRLNVSKTKAMLVSRKRSTPVLSLRLGESAIETVSSYKYLGITITANLSWSLHLNATCCKAKRLIGYLYRYFRQASTSTLNRLYQAIILPILSYGGCIWDPHHTTYTTKLEKVQEFAAKVVTRRWSTPGADLVTELHWPSLQQRRHLSKLCLCRRILQGKSLISPTVFLPHPSTTVRHNNSQPLFLPRVRTDHHRGTFFVSVVPLWNSIPDYIITLSSDKSFKVTLKQLLF